MIQVTPFPMRTPADYEALTQFWKLNATEKVCYNPEFGISTKEDYEFGMEIKKIDDFIRQGKKVCLFIGRVPDEKTPSETGEAQEDEVWVTADSYNKGPEITKGRAHLWFNLNQQIIVDKLQGVFSKIVVDRSTAKFFQNEFIKRFSVMLRDAESPLIFENPIRPQEIYDNRQAWERKDEECLKRYREDHSAQQRKELFQKWWLTTEGQELEAILAPIWEDALKDMVSNCDEFLEEKYASYQVRLDFPIEEGEYYYTAPFLETDGYSFVIPYQEGIHFSEEILKRGRPQLIKYLKNFFNQVEFHEDEKYPYAYSSSFSDADEKRILSHFIVRGLKTPLS